MKQVASQGSVAGLATVHTAMCNERQVNGQLNHLRMHTSIYFTAFMDAEMVVT